MIAGALRCRGLVCFFLLRVRSTGMSADLIILHCTTPMRYERRKHEKGHLKKPDLPRRDRRLYRTQISIRSVREHKKGALNSLLRAQSLRWTTTTTPKSRALVLPTRRRRGLREAMRNRNRPMKNQPRHRPPDAASAAARRMHETNPRTARTSRVGSRLRWRVSVRGSSREKTGETKKSVKTAKDLRR